MILVGFISKNGFWGAQTYQCDKRNSFVSQANSPAKLTDCFIGGGAAGERMQAFDWSATPLGPVDSWASSLRTAVSICLSSRFPIVMYWGADYTVLYNDAYGQILAKKHPWALGRPACEVWAEIWDVIAPMLDGVVLTGQATYSDDLLLILERNGYPEECYFSFSFSAIRQEGGDVGGVFTAVTETTRKVISERRLSLLNTLASQATDANTVEEACRLALITLDNCPLDIPFALLYLLDNQGSSAQLMGRVRIEQGAPAAPEIVDLNDVNPDETNWPLARAVQTREMIQVGDIREKFGELSGGDWPESPQSALILPITRPGQAIPYGLLVTGISPRRPLDEEYCQFLRLAAGQIATAIANTRAHEEERQRAEALAALDRAKTEFFSNISHEFRTPLTLMLGPLQDALAEAAAADSGETESAELFPVVRRERLELIYRNSLRLLKLVNNLLDFSRAEAGRMKATFEPTDLAEYTSHLASAFRSASERAGLRLEVDCPPLPEPVYVDRELWENIVLNLLSNALKFTLQGEIAVRLRWTGAGADLTVSDTGAGIPEDQIPHIFERFHRVRSEKARTYEGSGIGLALVQELVKIHGGQVSVESTLGKGSTFTVFLPSGMSHLPEEQVSDPRPSIPVSGRAEQYVEEALHWLPTPNSDLAMDLDIRPAPPSASAAERILLVDDNADMRDYLQRLLSGRWQVETATNGEEAYARMQLDPPSLVLSDVMLPGIDGFELLRQIRSDPRLREIPFILLSARAGDEARIEGLQAGASDYIVKPFSGRELVARVEARLAFQALRCESDQKVSAMMDRLSFLVHAGRLLASSLDYQAILSSLANLIVPKMADWCTITLVDGAGDLRREIIVHKDPEKVAQARQLESKYPLDPNASEGVPYVFRTGQPRLYKTISEADLRHYTNDPEFHKRLKQSGLTSGLMVPLIARGRTLGVISLISTSEDCHYTEEDLELVEQLAARAALAVENANLYRDLQEANQGLENRVQARTSQLEKALRKLQQEEDRLQAIFENSPMGIVLVDPEGRYKAANPTFLKMLGYHFDEIEQSVFVSLLHPEDAPHAWSLFQDLVSGKIDGYHNEKRFQHKDGHWVWVRMSRSVIRDKDGSPSYIIGMIEDISARKQVEAELASVQRQLLENVEAERLYFSQEVHDGPIQNLVALLYEVALAQDTLPEPASQDLRDGLENLQEGLKQTVGELRDICKELRPPAFERYGLAHIIASHAESFQEKHPELNLQLDMSWDGKLLSERTRLALFRVYQQALTNTLRHAEASRVDVRLKREGSQALLEIVDNGKGFRVPISIISLSHGGHLGLIGLAERIKAVGGDFQVESEPGKGTRIRAMVPVRG